MLRKLVIPIFRNNPKNIKTVENILNALALISFIIWVLKIDIQVIESEALFAGLMLLIALLNKFYSLVIDEIEFSPAHALAYGYVKNFLEPLIIQLLENGEEPRVCIYTPDTLDDLSDNTIDRIKAELKLRDYEMKKVNLNLRHGRARDILTVEKKENREWYFDFPNTLRSLIPYIEYKVGSKKNQSANNQKNKLGVDLIDEFFHKIDDILRQRGLSKYIHTTPSNLEKIVGRFTPPPL
jgi:hypothetical protein